MMIQLFAALFIFSADGTTVGSAPRECPSQGRDRETGEVVVGLQMLDDAARARCGWYRITGEKPEAHSNEVWKVKSYDIKPAGTAEQIWECTWRKVVPVKYSVYKITRLLKTLDVTYDGQTVKAWTPVLAWIKQNDLYEEYVSADEFTDDNPFFLNGITQLKAAFGLTDEQIAALLKECKK